MIRGLYYTVGTRPARLRALGMKTIQREFAELVRIGPAQVPLSAGRAATPRTDRLWYALTARNIFVRILAGLEAMLDEDVVYLLEDDVLYAPAHFQTHEMLRGGRIHYDLNLIYLTPSGFCTVHNRAGAALSMACGSAAVLREAFVRKLDEIRRGVWTCFEPVGSQDYATDHWRAPTASIDIRENEDHTWAVPAGTEYFQEEPGWPPADELNRRMGIERTEKKMPTEHTEHTEGRKNDHETA